MGDERGEPLRIDWAGAGVSEGKLTVELVGEAPKGLSKRFEAVLALIAPKAPPWEQIEVHSGTVAVSGVERGSERDLRHLIESVVTQINSDLGRSPDGGASAQPGEDSGEDAREAEDRQMSERFRAFAEQSEQTS